MDALIEAFWRSWLHGSWTLLIGPIAFVVAVPCALTLERRGKLYWITTSLMLATLAFCGLGVLHPTLLISPAAVPVLLLAAVLTVMVPVWMVYWLIASRRPQRALEVLYVASTSSTVVGAASLVAAASASV
jgi:hypothetical protein